MAIVGMPLFSMWAVGTLAKTLTYRMSGRTFIVSSYLKIPKVWSDKQKEIREQFRQKAKRYRLFLDTDPVKWADTMKPEHYNIPEV